ncbi:MAG: hypothetical protein JO316_04790 [Abitibacteriaceae bacterium]|nr:hypothetical protein [Abditibacteriaceae bacterium]
MDRIKQSRVILSCVSIRLSLLLLIVALAMLNPVNARAEDGPTVVKTSLHINVEQRSVYWPPGATKAQYTTACWVPRAQFRVRGPLTAGSQLSVDFTKPDGSAWLHFDLATSEIAADHTDSFETPTGGSLDKDEKKFILAVGTFGFKINYKNELEGKHAVLFSGKFKVNKVSESRGIASQKNMYNYYVNHDWALPIGYVWFDTEDNDKTPPLRVSMWFRNEVTPNQLDAHLFYQGKEIKSTQDTGGRVETEVEINTASNEKTDPKWSQWYFGWDTVRKVTADNYEHTYFLDKNPGEYEVKVLRNGKLSRDVKFTVGADGSIVDNGIAAANNIITKRVVVPVKVIGTTDGTWQQDAWKTDAFYGNPLKDFTAP